VAPDYNFPMKTAFGSRFISRALRPINDLYIHTLQYLHMTARNDHINHIRVRTILFNQFNFLKMFNPKRIVFIILPIPTLHNVNIYFLVD